MENYILSENLIIALEIVIFHREKKEKSWGYASDSALLSGWKQNLKDLREGKLQIKYTK
jgi:hypothetical protein